MTAVVVEDCASRASPKIVSFGASVFVNDAFMAEARAGREPNLADRVIRLELRGTDSPVLRRNAIARANSLEGLNIIVLHVGEAKEIRPGPAQYRLRYTVMEAFVRDHRGYQLKELLQEVWDELTLAWVQSWGWLRSKYAEYYATKRIPVPKAGHRPYLIGLTREEALAEPGSVSAPLFLHCPPRLGLSEGQQELLFRALDGETDESLAKVLRVSLPTVKMRWRAIYHRVESSAPDLLPKKKLNIPASSRGTEKRRRILEHVRHHPEELRPYPSPRRRAEARNVQTGQAKIK
jgi:hypothetical protein